MIFNEERKNINCAESWNLQSYFYNVSTCAQVSTLFINQITTLYSRRTGQSFCLCVTWFIPVIPFQEIEVYGTIWIHMRHLLSLTNISLYDCITTWRNVKTFVPKLNSWRSFCENDNIFKNYKKTKQFFIYEFIDIQENHTDNF
jgi:hypothetical protein